MSTHPPAVPEYAWHVEFHDGEREKMTWANALLGNVPPRTVGESGSWEFHLVRGGVRGSVDPLEHTDRYADLQELGRWSGRYVLKEPVAGEPRFREQVPEGEPSLLVGLQPSYPTPSSGVWGLIDSIDEQNSLSEAEMRVTLSVTMLAEYDEYDDRAAVDRALSF